MSQHDAPGVIMEEPTPSGAKPAPKSRAVWIAVAVIVVIIVVVLAAVLGGLFNPAPTKPALRIGTLLSITGALSQYGPGDTQGAYLAVHQINAAGGVLGQPIQLFTEDDQTDQTAAAAATTKLITQNHVNAIVGAQFSGGTIASIGIAQAAGVPMVSPSATSPALSNLTLTGGYFFRTAPSDALQGVVAANYLYTNLSYRDVNLVGRDDSYGRGLVCVFGRGRRHEDQRHCACIALRRDSRHLRGSVQSSDHDHRDPGSVYGLHLRCGLPDRPCRAEGRFR